MRTSRHGKYRPFPPVPIPDRRWPSNTIDRAPRWCSVDLRDGNQALVEPMDADRKLRLFDLLVATGFKEIEVGFPAASSIDFDFIRLLIDGSRIPEDVTIGVLTQARDELIERTFDSIEGAPRAIVHVYNSTSAVQRRVVFGLDRAGIRSIAEAGVRLVRERARRSQTEIILEYSPESFTGTELDFAVETCAAVMDVWEPSRDNKIILNLPATVELATPNVYADQIEWFERNLPGRENAIISIHPHNDRGTAVAAAELALMAGAERVEGTLFGNGERTGNVDIVTLALNMFTQGVDPELHFDDLPAMLETVEYCNRLEVHPRHPYAGNLVFTAFSGSHQDAINKGFAASVASGEGAWEVPYLPIDPQDIGRSYEAVVRINSQSGKGGIAYILEQDYGLRPPRSFLVEFSRIVQAQTEATGGELTSIALAKLFAHTYFAPGPFALEGFETTGEDHGEVQMTARLRRFDTAVTAVGAGNGSIDAFVDVFSRFAGIPIEVLDYAEHASASGADAQALAFVRVRAGGTELHGAGRHTDIVTASLEAIVSAVNRLPAAASDARENELVAR
jgi:2-isopropylmalate synthase